MALVAFDFDGTLSDSEMMVLLGERYGVAEEIGDITARAMRGELSYAESLYERAAMLDGLPLAEAALAFDDVSLRAGAADVIAALNDAGHTTAILTGGFHDGVEAALAKEDVTVDHVVANRLLDDGDALTGDADGPLIEGTKDDALTELCEDVGVDVSETWAVGDGANDLPMLKTAGRAVGFEPKPAVRPHCDVVVARMDRLAAVLREDGLL